MEVKTMNKKVDQLIDEIMNQHQRKMSTLSIVVLANRWI